MSIIRAIVAGERNPHELAALKDRRIQSSTEQIAKALTGDYRAEHLFVLQQELTLYDIYQQQISAIDREIENCLAKFESQTEDSPPPRKGKKRKKAPGNEPNFNLHRHLFRLSGVDFTQIDGLNVLTVQTILSEVGLNPTRFPSVKHFCSWLGLCPGSRITGGKVKSSQTRKVVNRAGRCFSDSSSIPKSLSFCPRFFLPTTAQPIGSTQSHYRYCPQIGKNVLSLVDYKRSL